MKRRELLKLLGASGIMLSQPLALSKAVASECSPDNDLWVSIAVKGGWDPTSLFDPKGDIDGLRGPINHFTQSEINQVGNFSLSPYLPDPDNDPFVAFFNKYYSETLLINGLETSTNNHATGEKHVWSGKIDDFYPCFASMVAGSQDTTLPLAFLSSGYYDKTQGLVAKSLLSADPSSLLEISQPNNIYPTDPSRSDRLYFEDDIYETIKQAQDARLERLIAKETLPKKRLSMQELQHARIGTSQLKNLITALPESLDDSSNTMLRQIQVCCAAFSTGISTAANLVTHQSFDTHTNLDTNHYTRAKELFETIDFLLLEAERQGFRDRLNIVIGSDFGRTPWYNSKNGKDHWSVTSMMFMGPKFRGNRVLGATSDLVNAVRVDPVTYAPSDDGIILTPGLINHQLRNLACVSNHIQELFPIELETESLNAGPLFT